LDHFGGFHATFMVVAVLSALGFAITLLIKMPAAVTPDADKKPDLQLTKANA